MLAGASRCRCRLATLPNVFPDLALARRGRRRVRPSPRCSPASAATAPISPNSPCASTPPCDCWRAPARMRWCRAALARDRRRCRPSCPAPRLAAALREAKRQVALAAAIADIGGMWRLDQVTRRALDAGRGGPARRGRPPAARRSRAGRAAPARPGAAGARQRLRRARHGQARRARAEFLVRCGPFPPLRP